MPIRGVHPVSRAHTAAYKMYVWLLSTRERWPKRKADNLHLQPRSKNASNYTSTPPYVFMTWIFALLPVVQVRYKLPVTMDAVTFLMHTQRQLNRVPPAAVTPSRSIYLAFTASCITCQCLYTIPCCVTVYILKGASASHYCTVERGYSLTKVTEYFVSLYTSVVIAEECNVTVNSDELTRATKYLTL
jgi:hypothetical protein